MDLESLTGHEVEDRTAWIRIQRHFYRQFLDGQQPGLMAKVPALSASFRAEVAPVLAQSAQVLFLLHQQVGALGQTPRASLKDKVLGNFERLAALWGGSARFAVLADLWREQTQEYAKDFSALPALIEAWHALLEAWNLAVQPLARDLNQE